MTTNVLIIITITVMLATFTLPAISAEQKQFQVDTEMEFPERLPLGEAVDFKIDVAYNGPYSWVKNLEPSFEVIPTRAQPYIDIHTDESFSQHTVWKGHVNTLHGTITVSEDSPFDAVFLSVSFNGDIRFDEKAVSLDPESTVSLKIGESQNSTEESGFYAGHLEWMSRCYMIGSEITARVTDPDANNDPQTIEHVNITVWSNNDDRKIVYVATETGKDTGVFSSNVFFTTTDSSPGKRIRAIDDSTIYAKYVDNTYSNSRNAVDVINTFVMSGLDVLEKDHRGITSKITYDPCALILLEKNPTKFNELDVFYPTPSKQLESGLFAEEVMCKEPLVLVNAYHGQPTCVKPESVHKLQERGWISAIDLEKKIAKETAYLVTYMVFQIANTADTISIDFEGPQKQVEQVLQDYEVSVMSKKLSNDGSYSSIFGNMTHANMQKFFEENPMNHLIKRG